MKNVFFDSTSACSPHLKRIPASQLRPGMFLVRIVDSWWKSPFFHHRRLIKDHQEIQLVLQSGIQEVEIDTARGLDVEVKSGVEEENFPHSFSQTGAAVQGTKECRSPKTTQSFGPASSDTESRIRILQMRQNLGGTLRDTFEGVKTGHALPMAALHQSAETIIREVGDHPVLVTEIMLLDNLERYEKALHVHVLDVAILSVLVGLQLEFKPSLLHEIAVAGLLHDVGFVRLPANIVKDQWSNVDSHRTLFRRHVNIGVTLIRHHAKGASLIHRMVGEHHEYADGSGFPRKLCEDSISEGGMLLGLADYFDELIGIWGSPRSLPPALALRRIFQEVHEGRFPRRMGEALVRTLGVFPVGTVIRLSSGEVGVVATHQAQAGVKPTVLILLGKDGNPLDQPREINLGLEMNSGTSLAIQEVLPANDLEYDIPGLLAGRRQQKKTPEEVLCD